MGRKKSQSNPLRVKLCSEYEGKSKEEILDELIDQIIENRKLKKKLRKYENPHTPSSKDERKTKCNFISKTGLPVGKKRGYRGNTRERKEPTSFINQFQGICIKCGKKNNPRITKEKIYEEIPKPQSTKVVKAQWGYYECSCGHCWESKPNDVPVKGLFGKNAQAHVTLLRFDDRLPLRKTVLSLKRQFNFQITSKGVYDVTKRVADKITPEYNRMIKKIRRTKNLHIDETKIKIQGYWYYIWIFRSKKYIVYAIRKERNRNVLDEILGYHYKGCINCDGLSAYKEYTKYLQRCWAHILRETKEMSDKFDDAKPMHNWMKDLFKKVQSANIKDPPDKRKKRYDECIQEMKWLVEKYSAYQHLNVVITKIKNGLDFWFTKILHPQIEATNNNAERPLREMVILKKIMGTLRNTDGAFIMERVMSFLATWKIQGKDQFKELRAMI